MLSRCGKVHGVDVHRDVSGEPIGSAELRFGSAFEAEMATAMSGEQAVRSALHRHPDPADCAASTLARVLALTACVVMHRLHAAGLPHQCGSEAGSQGSPASSSAGSHELQAAQELWQRLPAAATQACPQGPQQLFGQPGHWFPRQRVSSTPMR